MVNVFEQKMYFADNNTKFHQQPMCRITGILDFTSSRRPATADLCRRMRDTLAYGGPDDAGIYSDTHLGLHLGHRRLAVIDLSAAGHQPMTYKHLVVTFNGEIYNFKAIRQKLKNSGRIFQTNSDTEVLLQAWEEWGEEAVQHFRGMFAFAIWDQLAQKLTLCRDRMGVKPLYWYRKDGLFMFASELKAFHQHPAFDKMIDPVAVSHFLQQGYITSPHCIFRYAHKLRPGSFLQIDSQQNIREWRYWNVTECYLQRPVDRRPIEEVQKDLEQQLATSFQLRMVSDVPVGLFLSGGIDSSLLTAILQKRSDQPLKTFTIGVKDPAYDEAPFAEAIARHLGTDHRTEYITKEDLLRLVPQLPDICDEPFGDTSIFPTLLVSKLARQEVTVSLSADGSDELFGGYTRYEVAVNWFAKFRKMPGPVRTLLRNMLDGVDPGWLERNKSYFPVLRHYNQLPHKVHKLRQALKANTLLEFFLSSGAFHGQELLEPLQASFHHRYDVGDLQPQQGRLLSLLGLVDIQTYLEGDILTKVDRASMQVALEARDPFLDHHLVEFALSLPDELKIRGRQTKYLLRRLLYQYVPPALIDRPKQGFAIPMGRWLRIHFRKELEAIAADLHFAEAFNLQKEGLRSVVRSFVDHRGADHHLVWYLWVLHSWWKRWLESDI